ncbi:unnamed protein product [Vicia faba]|uniref:phosphopantothenoylcysteine decarboxylase n=1 Tax=Vicia faba TaxID=3906 RepID=A0AAV0YWG9_VICFA|nr:unnamed protein product [Vicia faba]
MSVATAPRKPRILLATSGSVVAVKFANLCHCFCEWAEVREVATNTSLHFIDRTAIPKDVTLYTDNDELSSWKKLGDSVLHIELRKWADIMDYCKPLFVAPAMNTFMWNNPFTEKHLISIEELGISLIPPVTKRLACGDYGNGAMAEPSTIYSSVKLFYESKAQQGNSRV